MHVLTVALEATSGGAGRHPRLLSMLVRFCSDCAANPFSSSFLSYRVRILERDAARTSDPDLGQRLLTSAELADIQPSQFLNDWRNIAISLTDPVLSANACGC